VQHAARWKYETQKIAKIRRLRTIAQLCQAMSSQLRHVSTIGKNLLINNTSSTCRHNMANFGPLTAEIRSGVWGTPANFNGFRVLAWLLRPIKLCTMYGRLLGWYIIIYIFGDFCPLTKFRHVHHFASKSCVLLYWQRYCTALQQRASAKLRRGTRNGITELSQRAPGSSF